MVDVVAPVFQLQVVAPVAVNNVFAPEHIVELFTVIVGCGVTTTFTVVLPVHAPLNPCIVQVVLVVGLTVTELPVLNIGNQVYVVAPVAVRVAVPPEHMLVELDVIDNAPLTVTEAVAVDVHVPFEPVTVQVVLLPGDTTKLVLVVDPGVHV